jgi:flagellar hook-length control protein FliK
MALILPSSSAPSPSAKPAPNAPARNNAPGEDDASSFGAALTRSLEPAGDKAAPVKQRGDKADKAKSIVEDLINAMAVGLGLIPLENRIVKATPSGDAIEVAGKTADATAPANTLANLARQPKSSAPDGLTATAALNSDTVRQATLAPVLSAAVAPLAGPADNRAKSASVSVLSTFAPVSDGAPLTLTAGTAASQNAAPENGLGGQTDQHGNQDTVEQTRQRAGKIAVDFSVSTDETAPVAKTGSPTADLAAVSTDTTAPQVTLLSSQPGTVAVASTTAMDASTPSLAPDVGSSEWGKALGQQVVHMGKAGQPLAELQLNPPGLGPLKVTLSMNDQQMQASFVSAHASVRLAIEAALPQLRSTLADNGISLGNTSVSAQSQQQQAFADRPGEQASPRSLRPLSVPDAPVPGATLASAPRPDRMARGASGVDTYA